MSDSKFCTQCGSQIESRAKFCASCGAQIVAGSSSNAIQTTTIPGEKSDKSAVTALLLCIFLGSLGIHRFYVGKVKTGILMLLTGGGLGIWTLIDLIRIACCDFRDSQNKYLIFIRGRASPLKLILIIVGSIITALIVYIILIIMLVIYFTGPMMNVIQNQLVSLRSGDIDKAYSYMAEKTKENISASTFKKFVENYPIMKSNVSSSFSERKVENNEGYAFGMLQAKDGAKATVEYKLIKENNNWKILSIHIKPSESSTKTETTPEKSSESYKIYEDKDNKYSIKYPPDWSYEQINKLAVLFSGKKNSSSYYSTISIAVLPLKTSGDSQKKVKLAVKSLKKQVTTKYSNIKFIDTGDVELPSNKKFHGESFVVTYTYKGTAIKRMQFVISNDSGKVLYIWGYTAPSVWYDKGLPVAKKMYESWLLED